MKTKKILLVVVAVICLCAISVFGTLAYLTDSADSVTNTFTAAGGGNVINDPTDPTNPGSFTLNEHKYEGGTDGIPGTLGTQIVQANAYELINGYTYPKDPFVTITGKTEVDCYLYLKVEENVANFVTYQIETCWLPLGNGLYVYSNGTDPIAVDDTTTGIDDIPVLVNDQFTVNANADLSTLGSGTVPSTLKFSAYLAQTLPGKTAQEVFDICFPPVTP